MQIHLYLMCFRTEALVASMLPPERFGPYMAVGPARRTSGHVAFFEIDAGLSDPFFKLEQARARCIPHPDGSPRKSTYVSIYRVLEHIPLSAFGRLHLCTRDGRVLSLDSRVYDSSGEAPGCNLYIELCPVTPAVASSLPPSQFVSLLTDPGSLVHIPRIFFADAICEMEGESLASYLPYRDPEHIADCLREIRSNGKKTKTVDRTPSLQGFYRTIRRGFFLGDQTGIRFYPFPTADELDEVHHAWWKSASMG